MVVQLFLVDADVFAILRPPLREKVAELLVWSAGPKLRKNPPLGFRGNAFDVIEEPQLLNEWMDRHAALRLLILQLFLVFIINVHIPDAVLTPDIAAVKLCELLQPIAMIETQERKPVLVVANDQRTGP